MAFSRKPEAETVDATPVKREDAFLDPTKCDTTSTPDDLASHVAVPSRTHSDEPAPGAEVTIGSAQDEELRGNLEKS